MYGRVHPPSMQSMTISPVALRATVRGRRGSPVAESAPPRALGPQRCDWRGGDSIGECKDGRAGLNDDASDEVLTKFVA